MWAYTNFYKSDGSPASDNYNAGAPYAHYAKARISFDVSSLYDRTDSFIHRVAKHEMGHVLGLDHTSPSYASLMKSDVNQAANWPTDYDITQVNHQYSD